MLETKKTIAYVAVAVVVMLLAFITTPRRITPDAFLGQGEVFFPDFIDPNEATTLEVIAFDEETASARPFKVTFHNGRWTIPSHHDYPADGKERLAKTAAGMIDIGKDDFRSDNVSDHGRLGVIDPLDETAGLPGRGKRITIKGADDRVLADLIVGSEVEGRPGFRFVRVPNQNRVYSSRIDVDVSTRFEDWIETDLLKTEKHRIDKVAIKDYSINERTRSIDQRDHIVLSRDGDLWSADRMSGDKRVDSANMEGMLTTLDELTVVGVRPKPEGLSASLARVEGTQSISQAAAMSLSRKGFYFSRDGQLLSNEGEIAVFTKDGVVYTLRFGEVVYGTGDAITAGGSEGDQDQTSPAENRYLFITAEIDASAFPEPEPPSDMAFLEKPDSLLSDADRASSRQQVAHESWQKDFDDAGILAEELNARFARWYYVISAASYEKLRLTRKDLVVSK